MSNFKWANAFKDGSLKDQLVFLERFNVNPNKFIYQLADDTLDLNAINMDALKAEFPNAEIVLYSKRCQQSNSCVKDEVIEDDDDEDDDIYLAGEWQSASLQLYDDHIIYYVDVDGVLIWYDTQNPEDELKRILKYIPLKVIEPKEAEIKLVAFSQDYYTIKSKIQPTVINIDENYNDDIKPVIKDIETFLDERKSGLVILRGKMGTGNKKIAVLEWKF